MRKVLFHWWVIVVGLAGSCAAGGNQALIVNVDGRSTLSLNGKWHSIIDPVNKGYLDWEFKPKKKGYFLNQKPKDKSDLVEYDFDRSPLLDVPDAWNSQRPELLYYEGNMWYKKSFDYQAKAGTRLFVYFGAANYHAMVFLNGELIGEHEGGFTPFNFEITNQVRESDNFLIVKVDNSRRMDTVPGLKVDWWNYGGLTRRVMLVEVPNTFIHDYFVQLKKGSLDTVEGWVQLNGGQAGQQISILIPEAGIHQQLTTDDKGYAAFCFPAKLELWQPSHPKLYDVVIESETDRLTDQIGFRSIETRGRDILLNGEPIFLRGVCISEENPLQQSNACRPEDARMILDWAQELGCNFVRLAHWPYNEPFIREADRRGILVWSEIPAYWHLQWDNPKTYACARQQLEEVITRDKNRACVILWSLCNETTLSDARLTFMQRLAARAREMDPTRLLTAALEEVRDEKDESIIIINDPLAETLDVVGCNEYMGWYHEMPGRIGDMQWRMESDKPLIMSEFGAGALYGYHDDRLTRWTEEFQEYLYQDQVKMLKQISFLRGTCPWLLFDFRCPRRHLPGIQDGWNRKGLISDRGDKKKAFSVMQAYYRDLKDKWGQ